MGRWLALLSLAALVIAAVAIDPCKRQTFRGRCPSVNGQPPKRSQFVLRYYLRSSGECVSYPYGHCASDESEPQLYRYKEECEVSCANNDPANLGFAKTEDNQTYGTVAPLKETPTVSSAEQKDAPAIKEAPATTSTPITTTEATTTEAPTARTEATTTTTRPSTASTTTEATTTEVPSTVAETTSSTTTTTQKSTTPITTTHAPERATVTQHESTSALEEDNSLDEDKEEVQESSSTSTAATTTTAAPTTSAPRTECERRRAAASSSKIRGGFIPVCDVNGTFQKVQCEPDGRQCFCVNNVGIEITNSRTRNGAKPDCDKIESAVTPKTQSCVGTVERGPCSSSFTHFYFDAAQQRCLSFVFSGCGGNGNNFETEADCQRQCVTSKPVEVIHKPAVSESKDVCSLPKERGPCDKYELRFYYNGETKECKYFFWGGCEGNSNNFETAEACQSACGVAKTVSQSRVPQPHQVDQIKTIPGTRVTPKGARPVVSVTEDSSADESSADITTTTPVPTTARVIPQTVPTRPSLRVAATSTAAPAQQTQQPIRNTPIVLLPGDQDTADSANRCAHPKDSGSCRGQFVRWYWDNQKKACDVFSYSGCEGNGNNFASKEECHAICHVEPVATTAAPDFSSVCKHDVDAGECNGVFQRFAFDSEAAECRPFTYGGCGGNGNNFATIAECRSKCQKVITQSVNVCEFEIEAGECTGVFPRFAYDRETNDCRPFTYGGCGGNGNNFAAIAECRNVCVKKSCQPVGQCDLTRCQVVNDNRGCPFCSCSPTKLPNPTPQCPAVDVARCQEPCIIINNRRGCQECACPKVPQTIIPPVSLVPPTPEARPPGFQHRGPQAPATPDVVAPPASSSGPAQPPAPRATTTTETAPKAPLPPSFTAELQEKCMQPLEPGPCKNFVDRWFFSQEDGTCHPFKYGGCAGNRNHFFTQRECEIHCARFLRGDAEDETDTPDYESEEQDTPRRAKTHGVSQQSFSEPLPVENYKTPNPPLRGPYGKKSDEPITTQGVKITTTTAPQTRATRISTTSTTTTTQAPVTEEASEEETDAAEEEKTTTEAAAVPTTEEVETEAEEEFEKDETEATVIVNTEAPTTTTLAPTQAPTTATSATTTVETTTVTTTEAPAVTTEATDTEEEMVEVEEEEDKKPDEAVEEQPEPTTSQPTSSASTSSTAASTTAQTTTAAPTTTDDVYTTLINEIDSMEEEEGVEENEVAPTTMMASSKFAVHRETEEVIKFEEVENTSAAKAEKVDSVKAITLKKVEITRPPSTVAPSTTQQSTTTAAPTTVTQTPSTEPSTEATTTVVETTATSTTTVASTTALPGTPAAVTTTTGTTTGAPVTTTQTILISTTESTTAVPSTTASPSTAAPTTTRFVTSSTLNTIDTDENVPDIDLNKIKAEGVNQKPVVEANAPVDIFESNLGRQPIPQGPIGKIGHNMDINLDDLDEPTTIVPTTSAVPVRPSTVAFSTTRTQPQQQTVSVQTNSAVHGLRNDRFDSSDPRIICGMPADAGICTNYVARWFFNSYTGQCEQFSFGSCGGNLNNFQDRTSCELRCMTAHPALHSQVPERCSYDKDSGFGKGYNVKWYFNMKNLRCEQFVYQGQGGNTNQFETLSDCERFCSPQPAQLRPTAPVAPLAPVVVTTAATTTIAAPAPIEYKSQTLRPLPDVTTVEDTEEYDSQENVDGENVREEEIPDISNPTPTQSIAGPLPPTSQGLPILPPGSEPRPPAAHDVKTITEEEVLAKKDLPVAQTTTTSAPTTSTAAPTEAPTAPTVAETPKAVYTARPLSDGDFTPREQLPIVGASPKEEVNYQTGRKAKAEGITNFADGRVSVDEINSGAEDLKNARPSCPNGRKEFRYADGRPVMCLPGLKHCPDKSVCYFNGVDYFCCPNEEDPYDRHAFGGYGGEETRNGYKVFGPLRVRRLMDETPLRNKRQTTIDRAFNTNPVSFNLDSVVAPLRFDAEKPRHISKAGVMRRPVVPKHGNPMCILPLAKGDCSAAHLRYYYDRNSDSCRLFYYSGCQGNANNFGSLEDCQRLCILGGQIAPAVQADAVTPATIVAPGQCPNGAPLGGNAPVLCGNSTDSIGCPTGFYCRGGPPDICCPGVDPNNKVVQHGVKVVEEPTPVPGIPRSYYKEALLSTPKYMCPDASDPLMGTNGQPLVCGAGFDGVNMCPREYYCAIDGAKGSRLCCPFFGASQRLPAETVIGPYFGRRNPNPGEVIDRGSLPSDQQEYQKKLSEEARSEEVTHHKAVPTTTPKAESGEEEYDGDDEEQHLMLKSVDRNQKAQQEAATSSPKASAIEDEAVNIDVPTDAPVIEEPAPVATPVKYVKDKSVCHLKPTEGRACREDEKPPRTNLHYFYSAKDNRCKLYFYRGCGGNENRFEKKADCEAMCMSA